MSVEYFGINFDHPLATYFCGESVTGRVVLKLKKEKRLKAIEIKFFGAAEVRWTETYTHKQGNRTVTRTIVYFAQEVYVENMVCVLGGGADEVTLPPGEYTYHFALILPSTVPSSFEGDIGHVRYTVKAKVVRPWRFNHETKRAFTVLSVLDLNNVLNAQNPLTASVEKTLCCGCCRSGPITIVAALPFSGFVPGQRLQAMLEIDNQSTSEVTIKSRLIQKVTYTGYSGAIAKSMEASWVVAEDILGLVEKRGSRNFTTKMIVPALPSSFLVFCNCIDIAYVIEIQGVISGMHTNAGVEIPIVIGVIPLQTQFETLLATDGQMPSTSGDPTVPVVSSAPPGYDYLNLPPPSYAECANGGKKADIRSEDDGKGLSGSTEFAPHYPMYRFQ